MRLTSVSLTWFRGAASTVDLPANGKSLVVYGQNGAGKSSFVDGVEYAINDGKLTHLKHEYSGRRQENAIPNTHTPESEATEVRIRFNDTSELQIGIGRDGTQNRTGPEAIDIQSWDYRRIILRQDEVSEFIHGTKGEKYSALLPLFGLHEVEVAAENLRKLAVSIVGEATLERKRGDLENTARARKELFGDKSDQDIESEIEVLHQKYCPKSTTSDRKKRCEELKAAIEKQLTELSDQNKLYLALKDIAGIDIAQHVTEVRRTNAKLAESAEPLITEKLAVLQSAAAFADKLNTDEDISCPACGQSVPANQFKEHIENERERLEEIMVVFGERIAAITTVIDAIKLIKTIFAKSATDGWCKDQKETTLNKHVEWINSKDPESYRQSLSDDDLTEIQDNCAPIIIAAKKDSANAPPEVEEITNDEKTIGTAGNTFDAIALSEEVARVEVLEKFIKSTEKGFRNEIRERSKDVIREISDDIETMWNALHPGTSIVDVHLYIPEDDKAIDIGLTFHGKEQDSPRLTLSEGYRNSLGLCIFLAMAKREGVHDRPLILDDVVISLDRDHRGMVGELLEEQFADRQVILLTHDRVWYAELRHQLDGSRWCFKMLLPFEDPKVGIRWSHKATTFDDARALLKDRPDSAGNDARKIMDAEMAIVTEKLQIRLPYLRGIKNDTRTCTDFIGRVASAGKACLQKKDNGSYACDDRGLDTLQEAGRLLVSWANRASHSTDLVTSEASKLIDKCEAALAIFRCESCKRNIWYSHVENSETYRCDCGNLRWRYGKETA